MTAAARRGFALAFLDCCDRIVVTVTGQSCLGWEPFEALVAGVYQVITHYLDDVIWRLRVPTVFLMSIWCVCCNGRCSDEKQLLQYDISDCDAVDGPLYVRMYLKATRVPYCPCIYIDAACI